MKELGLDPRQYKYLKSDDKSTTLQHKKGHTVTIAHDVLSPKNKSILQALSKVSQEAETPDQVAEAKAQKMAQGGKPVPQDSPGMMASDQCFNEGGAPQSNTDPTTGEQDSSPRAVKSTPTAQQAQQGAQQSGAPSSLSDVWNNIKTGLQKAEGGEVCKACGGPVHRKNYPMGGQVSQDEVPSDPGNFDITNPQNQAIPPIMNDQQKLQDLYNQNIATDPGMSIEDQDQSRIGAKGEAPRQIDVEAENKAKEQLRLQKNDQMYAQQATNVQNQAQNQAANELGFPQQAESSNLPATVPQNQQPVDSMGQPPQSQGPGFGDYGSMLGKALNESEAGIKGQSLAQQQLAQSQQNIYNQNLQAQQQAQQHYNDQFQTLDRERRDLVDDINNGHIDPEKYWDNHSKLASGIGMILAGFNPTNRPNAAIEYIQHQMDNNLKAQSENLGAKKSLLEA